MSKEKEVVSINGEKYPISKCRKFDKGYYLIGQIDVLNSGDCYLIDGKYYRFETGQIVFDYELLKYVIKNETLISGIVEFKEKQPIIGYFSKSLKNSIISLENGQKTYIRDLNLLSDQKQYRERLSDGNFYHINSLPAVKFNQIIQPSNEYKTSLPYDSGGVLKEYIQNYDSLEVEINKNVNLVAPLLQNLSFGLEFETTAGFIPDRILNKTGLIPLRDGSIPGIEYVTVPMIGEKGLQTVMNAVSELNYRTKYDNSCALHMHIGNVPRTPEFILAMFKMTCAIQDEMYTMFPLYKKYNFGVKNKNYSKPYPSYELLSQLDPIITKSNLNYNFDVLYNYLSMGESFSDYDNDLKNVKNHPADRDNRAKWNIRTRYYLNNMIPLIFGNKQTIEFRIHTATLNTNKIMNFMLMNAVLVNFVIEHTKDILENPMFLIHNYNNISQILSYKISTSSIKSTSFRDYIYSKLHQYITLRKNITAEDNRSGNIIGNEDKLNITGMINWTSIEITEEVITDDIKNLCKKQINDEFKKLKSVIVNEHSGGRISTRDAQERLRDLETNLIRDLDNINKTSDMPW